LVVRARVPETPLFARLLQAEGVARAPVREVLRRHWREVLLAAGARVSENACFYLFSVYALAYVPQRLGLSGELVLGAVNAAAPLAGGLAPIIASWLAHSFPGHYWPLALYIILVSLLSLACVWGLAETSRKDLSAHA